MMKKNYDRIKAVSKNIWNGMLGISVEICLTIAFIIIGFLVALLCWGILFR